MLPSMKRIALVALWSMLCVKLCAQQVTGVVTDANNGALPLVNVVVLSADSAFVSGTTTDNNGHFSLKQPLQGCIIKASLVGYETKLLTYAGEEQLNVRLKEKAFVLGEAVVHAQLPQTILKGEGMVTTVAGSVLEKSTSIEQLLDFIPHVSAQNGKVEVLGRGEPEIYINGKRMLNQMELERLNPENVKSVEVITNPGARYAATVTSVIRITTKRMAGEGLGVDSKTVGRVNEQRRASGFESLKMNWRKARWDVNAQLYCSDMRFEEDKHFQQFTYLNDTWHQTNNIEQELYEAHLYTSLAASYSFNTHTSLGASVAFEKYMKQGGEGDMHATNYRNGELHSESNSHFRSKGTSNAVFTNVYFVGKIGHLGVDFNSDYYWKDKTEPMYTTESYREVGKTPVDAAVDTWRNTVSRLFANKLVLSVPVAKGAFSVGGEYSHSKRNNRYEVLPTGVVDDENNQIKENMASAFADFSQQFGKLGLQLGLRFEDVDFNYYEQGVRMAGQSKRYADWFPSVALSFPLGKVQMQLAYAADINRPSYRYLRSGVQFDNRVTYESGNPFLLPTISRNLSYSLSWKWVSLSTMFAHMSNQMCYIIQPYKGDPTLTLLRPENMPSFNKMQASLSVSPSIGVWHPSFEAMFYKQWFKMNIGQRHSINNPWGMFNLTNTFDTRWLTASLIVRTRTEGNMENMFTRKGYFGTDLSLHKSLLDGKLLLQLYASDIFGTADEHVIIYSGEQRTTYLDNHSSSTITFTLRYRFNSSKSKYQGSGAGKAQKNRM